MAHLLVLIIDDETFTPPIVEAWENAGVTGITMEETTGSQRAHNMTRDDLPLFASLRSVLVSQQKSTRMFLSVIESDEILARSTDAVLKIIPDFERGHRGIMFTIPIARVWGNVNEPKS